MIHKQAVPSGAALLRLGLLSGLCGDLEKRTTLLRIGMRVTRTRPKANQYYASVVTNTATQYDKLGRIVSISYDDNLTPNKNYFYDVIPSSFASFAPTSHYAGRLVAMSSGSGSSATGALFNYDASGNVVNIWQCAPSICGSSNQASRPLSMTYDLTGIQMSESDAFSGNIVYTRTAAEEITSVANQTYQDTYNPASEAFNFTNTPFGPTSYMLGNSLIVIKTQDSLGRNTGIWACNGAVANAGCNNGANQVYGNLTTSYGSHTTGSCDTIVNQCQSHGYDEFNRLTSITDNSQLASGPGSFTFAYDRWGNRTQQISQKGASSPSYSFDSANHNTSFFYDAAGNQRTDVMHTYTYDAEGNVLQVDGGSTAQYVYNALNQRVAVYTSSSQTEYVYDQAGRRVSSWNATTNTGIEGRIYMDGTQIAYRAANGQTYFEHQDWMGTERARTDYQGLLVNSEYSLAYGDGYQQSPTVAAAGQDNAQFAGQEQDNESTTSHAQFRQYSSLQGRWMSPDPDDGSYRMGNPQSLNRYIYAMNNPFSFSDPSGLDGECPVPERRNGATAAEAETPDPITTAPCQYLPDYGGGTTVTSTPYDWGIVYDPGLSEVGMGFMYISNSNDSGGNAPSNGPTKSGCLGKALSSDGNGASLALDVLGVGAGFLPGGGLVTGSARAATVAFGAQVGLTAASTGVSIAYKSGPGIVAGILGGQVALTAKSVEAAGEATALLFGKSIPIVGVAVNAGALLYDGYQTYKAYSGCLAGVHE